MIQGPEARDVWHMSLCFSPKLAVTTIWWRWKHELEQQQPMEGHKIVQEKWVNHAYYASFANSYPLLAWNLHRGWNYTGLVLSQQTSCVHNWSRCQDIFFTVILCDTSEPTRLVYKAGRASSQIKQKTSLSLWVQKLFLCLTYYAIKPTLQWCLTLQPIASKIEICSWWPFWSAKHPQRACL